MGTTNTEQEENTENFDLLTSLLQDDTINEDEENETRSYVEETKTRTLLGGNRTMANELATYRASTVGSELLKFFIEVPTDTSAWSTKAYHMALLLAESNQMDAGVEEEDVPDVTTKVAEHVIKSYKLQFSHSGVFPAADPVAKFERYLMKHQEVGDKTKVNLIQMDEFDEVSTGVYSAVQYTATCVPQSFGGEAQGKIQIEAQYTITSEGVFGTATYDAESGVATFTPA